MGKEAAMNLVEGESSSSTEQTAARQQVYEE
jgi:hypothetical protein